MILKRVNKNKKCVFNSQYVGGDLYVTMLEDKEREFIVTHNVNIKSVAYFTGRESELKELCQRIGEGCKSVLASGMGELEKQIFVKNCLKNIQIKMQHMKAGYLVI